MTASSTPHDPNKRRVIRVVKAPKGARSSSKRPPRPDNVPPGIWERFPDTDERDWAEVDWMISVYEPMLGLPTIATLLGDALPLHHPANEFQILCEHVVTERTSGARDVISLRRKKVLSRLRQAACGPGCPLEDRAFLEAVAGDLEPLLPPSSSNLYD